MKKERLLILLKKHRISPSLLLDQNFMTDSKLIKKIVSLADIKPGETVLEIGAGAGTLTPEIAKKAKRVLAVEIDKAFLPLLKELCPPNTEIIRGNILKLIGGLSFDKIVSNTPYSICEPLLQKLAKKDFKMAVLALPEGFIKRIKEGGSKLSLFTKAFFRMEEKLEVPRRAFYPAPRVESGVLLLSHKTASDYKREPCRYILKKLFLQEDRKLKNALRDALIDLHRDILDKGITNSKGGGSQRGRGPLEKMTKKQARETIGKLKIPEKDLEALVSELKGRQILDIKGKCKGLKI